MKINPRFINRKEIGHGSFSVVYSGYDNLHKRPIALKKILSVSSTIHTKQCLPANAVREIMTLKCLHGSSYVIQLFDIIAWGDCVCLILDLADSNLEQIIHCNGSGPMGERMVKYYFREITQGLAFCHLKGIMHRDLKPSNILVWKSTGTVKLSDFGLAQCFKNINNDTDKNCHATTKYNKCCAHVTTRWYQAPEMLLRSEQYDEKVDLFALGVVAAEMIIGRPLFPGENDLDQINKIMSVIEATDLSMIDKSDLYELCTSDKLDLTDRTCKLSEMLNVSDELKACIQKTLSWDPDLRPSASQLLLNDAFFIEPLPNLVVDE